MLALLPPSNLPIAPISFPMLAQAPLQSPLQFIAPPEPESGDPGGRGRGGGSRTLCPEYEALTAIVPQSKSSKSPQSKADRVWGQTTESHPSFWFYVPQELGANTPMQFVLKDSQDAVIYRTEFTPATTPAGILRIPLPHLIQPLQVNQSYRWGLNVFCDAKNRAKVIFVNGMIRRIELPAAATQQLQSARSGRDRALLFAKQGIWFDAVNALARERACRKVGGSSNHPELEADWVTLLKQGKVIDVEPATEKAAIVSGCDD